MTAATASVGRRSAARGARGGVRRERHQLSYPLMTAVLALVASVYAADGQATMARRFRSVALQRVSCPIDAAAIHLGLKEQAEALRTAGRWQMSGPISSSTCSAWRSSGGARGVFAMLECELLDRLRIDGYVASGSCSRYPPLGRREYGPDIP